MSRVHGVLVLAVLGTALMLVNVQYEGRRLYYELDRARSTSHKLDSEFERLQIEKRAQATPLRIERLAKERLQMRSVTPATTVYIGSTVTTARGAP